MTFCCYNYPFENADRKNEVPSYQPFPKEYNISHNKKKKLIKFEFMTKQ